DRDDDDSKRLGCAILIRIDEDGDEHDEAVVNGVEEAF
ncbi:hypothetical protein A2U01_0093784, partial [Trifolium medium]|nr:hypothetical protein [Trifolium medium]